MDPVTPFDWERLFLGVQPPLFFLEIAFRVTAIYVFAVVALRFMGKRGRRQMTSFEYVLIIALGSATGDSMFYPTVPIFYAWLIILVMIVLDRVLAKLQSKHDKMNDFLVGEPRIMVERGEILQQSLDEESMNRNELLALLRSGGVADLENVEYAFLETSGGLGIINKGEYEKAINSTYPEDLAR